MEARDLSMVLEMRATDLRSCETNGMLEEASDKLRDQKALPGQVAASIKTAVNVSSSVIKARKKAAAQKMEDAQTKKIEQEKLAEQERIDAERQRLVKVKRVEPFRLKLEEDGLQPVQVWSDDDAFLKSIEGFMSDLH